MGLFCVSCQNRVYEWKKGKNSKGSFPKEYRGLSLASISYRYGEGEVKEIKREVIGRGELVAQALRDADGEKLCFGLKHGYGYVKK